mgnify:CR=1 FL=1
MSVLEKGLYYRGTLIKDMSALENLSILQRYPYLTGVSIREMFILERYPNERGVSVREMFILERYPYQNILY